MPMRGTRPARVSDALVTVQGDVPVSERGAGYAQAIELAGCIGKSLYGILIEPTTLAHARNSALLQAGRLTDAASDV